MGLIFLQLSPHSGRLHNKYGDLNIYPVGRMFETKQTVSPFHNPALQSAGLIVSHP